MRYKFKVWYYFREDLQKYGIFKEVEHFKFIKAKTRAEAERVFKEKYPDLVFEYVE